MKMFEGPASMFPQPHRGSRWACIEVGNCTVEYSE